MDDATDRARRVRSHGDHESAIALRDEIVADHRFRARVSHVPLKHASQTLTHVGGALPQP